MGYTQVSWTVKTQKRRALEMSKMLMIERVWRDVWNGKRRNWDLIWQVIKNISATCELPIVIKPNSLPSQLVFNLCKKICYFTSRLINNGFFKSSETSSFSNSPNACNVSEALFAISFIASSICSIIFGLHVFKVTTFPTNADVDRATPVHNTS